MLPVSWEPSAWIRVLTIAMASTVPKLVVVKTELSATPRLESVLARPDGPGPIVGLEFVQKIDTAKIAMDNVNVMLTTQKCVIPGPENVSANRVGAVPRVIDHVSSCVMDKIV